jgi:hypothetical protein
MPTARQFAAICVLWAVASGGAACTRLWEGGTPLLEAAFSDWAFKAAAVGAVLAALVTPLVVIGSRAPRTWGRLALRIVHGSVLGPPLGMAIMWGILYAWPPEDMSRREQAFVFAKLFWKGNAWKLGPACAVAGASSVWIAARISRPRAYSAAEEPAYDPPSAG